MSDRFTRFPYNIRTILYKIITLNSVIINSWGINFIVSKIYLAIHMYNNSDLVMLLISENPTPRILIVTSCSIASRSPTSWQSSATFMFDVNRSIRWVPSKNDT